MIVTLGTTTVDLMVTGLEQLPAAEGDEFTSSNLTFCERPLLVGLGGNGANSAYTLGRLGHPSRLCSARGHDQLGDLVEGWLESASVQTKSMAVIESASTASTTVIMDTERNRQSFYHPGALNEYRPAQLQLDLLDGADALLISGYPLLPRFRSEGYSQLLTAAKARHALTALDIGPAIGDPATTQEITPLLDDLDFLLCNEHEAQVATGQDDLNAAAEDLLAAGAQHVVIKRGSKGSSLFAKGEDPLDVPAFDVQANVTVGAGDAFNSGFLLARVEGQPLASALGFGNAVAALVVGSPRGVLTGPTRQEVDALLDEHPDPNAKEGNER